jgi:hypothetical protein
MTPEQFAALAALTRIKPRCASYRFAELMLVDNLPRPVAARAAGISDQAAHNVVKRIAKTRALAKQAMGIKKGTA